MSTNARIFINYRRSDSAGWARQLHGDLNKYFDTDRVFRDVAIEPGVDFVAHIESVMDACEVCIAVIGPRWGDATCGDGRRRLDDPGDLVRLEIERALQRPDVHVIPVLVDGARMPAEHELPLNLRPLARRNACELTDSRWDFDIEVLCRQLRKVLGESTLEHVVRQQPAPVPAAEPSASSPTAVLVGVLATLAAALGSGVLAAALSEPLKGSAEGVAARAIEYATERGALWAIIGAAVVAVAAATFGRVRIPLGRALVGAGAVGLAGAAGGAGLILTKNAGHFDEDQALWLLRFVSIVVPAVGLGAVVARSAGARTGESVLAGIVGAALAALVETSRTVELTADAVLISSAIVAVLATSPHRRPSHVTSGASYAVRSSTSL